MGTGDNRGAKDAINYAIEEMPKYKIWKEQHELGREDKTCAAASRAWRDAQERGDAAGLANIAIYHGSIRL